MDKLDCSIINHLQKGFPVCEYPFRELARIWGITEENLIQRIQQMLDDGLLTRFGPLFNAEHLGGVLSLCALKVPAERFESVCEIVNEFDEVAHNYEREHELNMWFVIAAGSDAEKQQVLQSIESRTGLEILDLPKKQEFFIGLHFEV